MDREQAANELKRRGVTLEDMQNYFLAVAEPVAAMGSGIVAEPLAGFAGLAAAPFGSDAAANAVNYYRDKLTYSPRSEAGQSGMAAVGEAMAPIGEAMDYAASGAGDYIYDKTGSPALAAAAYSAPTAALELLGLKGVNQLSKSGKLGQPLEFGDIGSGGVGNKQRGIFAGVKAKGADLKRQAAAEELANRGIGRDQIWQETGWFNDVDGSWKFEIDDSQARLRSLDGSSDSHMDWVDEAESRERGIPLSSGVEHSEMFNSYPSMQKARLSIGRTGGSHGMYDAQADTVGIKDPFDYPQGEARSTLLHETQHAIQEREGFAKGGSPKDFAGIQEQLNSQNLLDDAKAKGLGDFNLMMKGKSIDDIEQVANEFAEIKGISVDEAYDRATAWHAMNEGKGFDAVISQAQEMVDMPIFSAHDKYERLAGEAEARNVQTRMDYTPEQRQAAAPWTTLDVPESELVVRGNSKGPMMSVSKAQAIEELEKRGIPMDYDSRMARAKEQGFKPRKKLYHGSSDDIDAFDLSKTQARDFGFLGKGVYTTGDPKVADYYANTASQRAKSGYDNWYSEPNVMQLMTKANKSKKIYNDEKTDWSIKIANGEITPEQLTEKWKSEGYDSVEVIEPNGSIHEKLIFDPSDIRSVNAAFDPADIGKSGLLKSVGGVGLGYQFLSGEDEQNQF